MRIEGAIMPGLIRFSGLVFVFALMSASSHGATWTDASGQFKVEAHCVGADEDSVTLMRIDNYQLVTVPIGDLSEHSKLLVSGYLAEQESLDVPVVRFGDDPSIEETAKVLNAAAMFDPWVLWDWVPPSYRAGLNEIVRSAARGVDEKTWNACDGVLKKLDRVLTEKQSFVEGSEALKRLKAPHALITSFSQLIKSVSSSDLTDRETMQNFDGDSFFLDSNEQLRDAYIAVLKAMEAGVPRSQSRMPAFEVISSGSDEAVVRVLTAAEVKEQKFLHIERRWIPEEMRDNWETGSDAKAAAALFDLSDPNRRAMVESVVAMLSGALDQLDAAQDQASFDAAIMGSVQRFMMGLSPGN